MRFASIFLTLFLLSPKLSCLVGAQDIEQLRLSAEQGDEASQFKLDVMYDNGTDVQKDDQEAAKWYELAAEQGNEKTNPRLCELYAFGDIAIRNYEESIKWCKSAAKNGHTLAHEVGKALMYHHGIDAKPNLRKARR